jgi:hypothetical protein
MKQLLTDQIMADSPKVFWELQDASGNPQDSSGNGFHVTSVGGTPIYRYPGLRDNRSLHFEAGYSISRAVPSTAQTNITMEAVIHPTIVSAANQLVFYNGNSALNGWGLLIGSGGANFTIYGLLGGVAGLPNGPTLSAGPWYHVALRRNASNFWDYIVNGVVYATGSAAADDAATGSLTIGSASYQHDVSHFALYETALSDQRLIAHYQAAFAGLQTPGQRIVTSHGVW